MQGLSGTGDADGYQPYVLLRLMPERQSANFLKKLRDLAAQSAQRKLLARSRPLIDSDARRSGDVRTLERADRSSLWLRGSTSRAASPATSGSDDTFDVITGTPTAIACTTGNPNPSYNEGYAKTVAAAVSAARWASGM